MKNFMILVRSSLALLLVLAVFSSGTNENGASNQESITVSSHIPYLKRQGTATQLIVKGKPFMLICGELHNSTCGSAEYMRPVWKDLADRNLNSVIATVSWELVEPEEGKFDFSLVDSVINGAREANLKLVLIWFASWKNAGSIYIPSWMKTNYEKYPRARDEQGKPLEILSTLGEVSRDADAKAFAELMRHIKEVDSDDNTVIMMQVENEMGLRDHDALLPENKHRFGAMEELELAMKVHVGKSQGNARRDFSEPANRAFYGSVPKKLIDYLVEHKENLFPELKKVWSENGFKTSGTWEEVFGKSKSVTDPKDWLFYSYYTEELFMAWNYASYTEKVAAAGKQEYPLPMYVNAWLKQRKTFLPGRFPSGGPLPEVLDIWRAAAPSIDFISPDIYIDEFRWCCKEFTRSSNPLFIPETRGGAYGAARSLFAFGEHDAIGFAPFGIDGSRHTEYDPLIESYGVLKKMAPIILENQGRGTMRGILIDEGSPVCRIELGDYIIESNEIEYGRTGIAGGLIIQTGPQEFICAGRGLNVLFIPKDKTINIAVEAVDEGTFENGKWVYQRRLNGDETHSSTRFGKGMMLPASKVSIQKIKLYKYK
jgi:hypothetical protein